VKALLLSASMFSVLPVPVDHGAPVDRAGAARALRWLPAVGAGLGGLAVLPALAVWRGGGVGAPLLAAVLIVVALALLSRGLHLDGLADLADGLGSRRPGEGALEVMARSDIGPFGVAAVVLTLLLEVAGLAQILGRSDRAAGVVAVIGAVAVSRVAAIWAAGRSVPAARPGGFGALVAGSASEWDQVAITVGVIAAGLGCGVWAGLGWPGLIRLGASWLAALVLASFVRRHAVTRLGGMTGDVFGALIELALVAAVVIYAGTLAWR
jgi:adenosylcobinamide-GDP ribazoletransferase